MRIPIAPVAFALAALLCGCAQYKIQPISAKSVSAWPTGGAPASEGYIFYQPELYFAATITTEVSKDASGKDQTKESLTVAPIYLPNYQKPYRLTTHNFLAKADFAFDFENGWKLTKLSDKSDNSTLANTLAGELSTILSATGLAVKGGPPKPKTRVILFRPEFDLQTGYFTGFKEAGVVETNDK